MNTERRPWWAWIVDPYGRTQVWRSVETWPRRASISLLALLAAVDYLLVALVVFAKLSLVADLAVALGAASFVALTVAEALYVLRPTQERLARADRLVLVTFCVVNAIFVIVILASLVSGEL